MNEWEVKWIVTIWSPSQTRVLFTEISVMMSGHIYDKDDMNLSRIYVFFTSLSDVISNDLHLLVFDR
jgi:hypothetical protein